jgi:protein involved in sex pheromone biosynthesis
MKKLIVLGVLSASTLLYSCNNNTGSNSNGDKNSTDNVEEHSGEEITPQAKIDSDSTRLEVDTISSAESANDGGN